MPGLENSGYECFRDNEKKLLISCFGVHVSNPSTHNLSTRTGNFIRESVIVTGALIDDDAAVNDVDGDYYYYYRCL
jgi:hypothetical protein